MREKEILQFVKDELSTVDSNSEDVVYDYSYIGDAETVKRCKQNLLCRSRKTIY